MSIADAIVIDGSDGSSDVHSDVHSDGEDESALSLQARLKRRVVDPTALEKVSTQLRPTQPRMTQERQMSTTPRAGACAQQMVHPHAQQQPRQKSQQKSQQQPHQQPHQQLHQQPHQQPRQHAWQGVQHLHLPSSHNLSSPKRDYGASASPPAPVSRTDSIGAGTRAAFAQPSVETPPKRQLALPSGHRGRASQSKRYDAASAVFIDLSSRSPSPRGNAVSLSGGASSVGISRPNRPNRVVIDLDDDDCSDCTFVSGGVQPLRGASTSSSSSSSPSASASASASAKAAVAPAAVLGASEPADEAEAARASASAPAPASASTFGESSGFTGGRARARAVGCGHQRAQKPLTLLVKALHPYQQAALAWMLHREGYFAESTRVPKGRGAEAEAWWGTCKGLNVGGADIDVDAEVDDEIDVEIDVKPGLKSATRGFPHHPNATQSGGAALCRVCGSREALVAPPPFGGILADEQGMGKTVQLLALTLTHLPTLRGAPLGAVLKSGAVSLCTLVVCPLMLVRQWQQEIGDKVATPRGRNVLVHHGPHRTTSPVQLAAFDYVLTTYSIVRSEWSKDSRRRGSLFGLRWWRVILDECHCIRNSGAAVSVACLDLVATNCWCLSGTPMQNSVCDLYPLLKFIGYPRYVESVSKFKLFVGRRTEGLEKLQALLAEVMLRRRKDDTFDGKPILNLPIKLTEELECELTPYEQQVYDAIEAKVQKTFLGLQRRGLVQANYMHILAMLQRLRQACDSVILVRKVICEERAPQKASPPSAASANAQKMATDAEDAGDCLVCMEPIEVDSGAITSCGHAFCLECAGELLEHSSSDAEDSSARCPLCRAPIKRKTIFPMKSFDCLNALIGDTEEEEPGASPQYAEPRSTKLKLVLKAVREMLQRDPDAKAIVFSSFTRFLDLVQSMLEAEAIAASRVDGSQDMAERSRQLELFHRPKTPVLLMSLKCGVGLNLTCANTVVLAEPWWNPFCEAQAVDRAHRIGQEKPVRVLRLLVRDSVEERISALQEKKRLAAAKVLSDDIIIGTGGDARRSSRLTDEELMQLFGQALPANNADGRGRGRGRGAGRGGGARGARGQGGARGGGSTAADSESSRTGFRAS